MSHCTRENAVISEIQMIPLSSPCCTQLPSQKTNTFSVNWALIEFQKNKQQNINKNWSVDVSSPNFEQDISTSVDQFLLIFCNGWSID